MTPKSFVSNFTSIISNVLTAKAYNNWAQQYHTPATLWLLLFLFCFIIENVRFPPQWGDREPLPINVGHGAQSCVKVGHVFCPCIDRSNQSIIHDHSIFLHGGRNLFYFYIYIGATKINCNILRDVPLLPLK